MEGKDEEQDEKELNIEVDCEEKEKRFTKHFNLQAY